MKNLTVNRPGPMQLSPSTDLHVPGRPRASQVCAVDIDRPWRAGTGMKNIVGSVCDGHGCLFPRRHHRHDTADTGRHERAHACPARPRQPQDVSRWGLGHVEPGWAWEAMGRPPMCSLPPNHDTGAKPTKVFIELVYGSRPLLVATFRNPPPRARSALKSARSAPPLPPLHPSSSHLFPSPYPPSPPPS